MRSVAIVGAGIGGLAVATGLAQRGMDVTVYERAEELGEVGAGLQLSPNAMHALADLGLADAIGAAAFEPQAAEMRHWKTGATLFSSPLKSACRTRYGAPYLHVHRADLHRVLAEAAEAAGAKVQLGVDVTGYAQKGQTVHLTGPESEAEC